MAEEERRIDSKEFKYKFKVFYISHDRDILYERINKRVDIMMQTGLIDEAKKCMMQVMIKIVLACRL